MITMPRNIMFLDDEAPMLIDFDTCWKEAQHCCMKRAKYLWTDDKYFTNNTRERTTSLSATTLTRKQFLRSESCGVL